MVDAEGVDSNHLFITLSQWNEILQDKSIPNSSDYPRKLDTSEKPPKTKKAQAKTYSVDSVKRIGEQFAFRVTQAGINDPTATNLAVEPKHGEIHEGSSQDLGNSCTNVVGLPLRRAEFY